MPTLSPALQVTWQIAATEAATARYQCIELEHLFIGVCKVGNHPPVRAAPKSDAPEQPITALSSESKAIDALFVDFHLDRVEFYRQVRQRIGKGNSGSQSQRK